MASEFGNWLQRQLDRRDWKQADLARRIEASTGLVSMWVSGKRVPSTTSVDKIADVFGISVDYVLSRAGHRPADVDDGLNDLRQEVHAAIDAHPISERDLRLILAMVQQWANERCDATNQTLAQ